MSSVKDDVANILIAKLDSNPQNEDFNVAVDMKVAQTKYSYFSIPNYYTVDEIEYTPAVLDFQDEPAGITGIDKTTWTIEATFGLTGKNEKDQNFINEKDAIEFFRKDINDNPRTFFVIGNDTYQALFLATSLSRVGVIQMENGRYKIIMSMGITVITGIGLQFGQDTKFELQRQGFFTWTELKTTNRKNGTGIEKYTDQASGDTIGFNIAKRGTYQGIAELIYIDNLANEALYDLGAGILDFETEFELRITKPNTGTSTKNVIIDVASNEVDGNDIRMTCIFSEVE